MSRCDDYEREAQLAIATQYGPMVQSFEDGIKVIEAAGGDAHKQLLNGVVTDYYTKRDEARG